MTLQEIQYKAQGIIHKWRDDDSAPYVEFVEELAHMTVPEPSISGSSEIPKDHEEAARHYLLNEHSSPLNAVFHQADLKSEMVYHKDIENAFIAGAKWQKEQMMEEAMEGEVCIPNVWVEHKEGKELVVRAEISKELGFKFGDKVRIIIVKED